MDGMFNLFGEEFKLEIKQPDVKKLIEKTKKPKKAVDATEKALKSKKLTMAERVALTCERIIKVLGHQRSNVVVIRTKQAFADYITKCIEAGRVAIDTETNNSTDPVTCKIMGLCLYYPGGKQAYIPVNHVDLDTGELLKNQLTTQDIKEELQRILDAKTFIVMHNGKFDYEVLKCTCDIEVVPNWDTIIGVHTIDENEKNDKLSLKWQYVNKIDPTQAKYDLEHLCEGTPYQYLDPDIFALYAATDSLMTDKIYELQESILTAPGNEKLLWLFKTIEMPIVKVAADIELAGVCIDQAFGERLRLKYNKILEDIDEKVQEELRLYEPKIAAWRLSPEANTHQKVWQPKKTKMTEEEIAAKYPEIDEKTGKRYKKANKTPAQQLDDPINLASPTQLAILFYDILKCPTVSKKSPRGTGKEELEAIAERKPDLLLCNLLLERRGIVKLVTTYIDVLPALAQHWPDGRIRYKLNSIGTDTGRFSSGGTFKFLEGDTQVEISGFNSQNIPSRGDGKITRLLFEAKKEFADIEVNIDRFTVHETAEVETIDGWKYGKDIIALKDSVITDEGPALIEAITYNVINKEYEFIVRKC